MVVRADDKKAARLAMIADLITRVDYKEHVPSADPAVLRRFDEACLTDGMLAR
jgi:hypothetical protein